VADRHEAHDLLLVAAFAAGDLEVGDLALAEALVGACDQCATLAADLRAISRATAELPAPRRPHDFFVRPADAERLRPNRLRRLAAAIAGPRAQLARPLAGGLMMIGFAGLLVASFPGLGGPASLAPADQRLQYLASPSPGSEVAGEPRAAAGSSTEPVPSDEAFVDSRGGGGQGASLAPAAGGPISTPQVGPDGIRTNRDSADTGPSPLVIGSVALVAIGAFLFLASLLRPGPRRS
jgi:hypothetical protein